MIALDTRHVMRGFFITICCCVLGVPGVSVYANERELPVICIVAPFSGAHKALGERVFNGVKTVVESVSAEVTLRRVDTGGGVLEAISAVLKAGEGDCLIAVGGIGDREALAVADAAVEAQLPLVALGAAPDKKERIGVAWVRVSRRETLEAMAEYLISKNVFVVHVFAIDSAYAKKNVVEFSEAFDALGGKVAVTAFATKDDLQKAIEGFAARVNEVRVNASCMSEAIFIPVSVQDAKRILGFFEYYGILNTEKCPHPILVGPSSWGDTKVSFGDILEGAIFPSVNGNNRPTFDSDVLDGAGLALAAIRASNGGGRERIVESLSTELSWAGPLGDRTWSRGRILQKGAAIFLIRKGHATLVGKQGE